MRRFQIAGNRIQRKLLKFNFPAAQAMLCEYFCLRPKSFGRSESSQSTRIV